MKADSSSALEPQTPPPLPGHWGEVLFFSTRVSIVTSISYTALQMQAVMETRKAAVSSNYALIELAQC